MNNEHRHPDPVQEFSQRVEEASWPLTLDPSPRAIHLSGPTARGEGRVRGHANSTVSGSRVQLPWWLCALATWRSIPDPPVPDPNAKSQGRQAAKIQQGNPDRSHHLRRLPRDETALITRQRKMPVAIPIKRIRNFSKDFIQGGDKNSVKEGK